MAASIVIYHNPRCTKSRETLSLLEARGINPQVIEYLKSPPTAERILELARWMGVPVHDLVRTKEAPYRECRLSTQSSDKELADAIAAHPILLERPIVVANGRAAVGRPPENVLAIL